MNFLTTRRGCTLIAFGLLALSATTAHAHFIWLVPADEGQTVQVYFGEDASPDDPALLKYVDGMQAWSVGKNGNAKALKLTRTDETLTAAVPKRARKNGLVIATHDLGVMERGGAKFRLKYYAKTGPAADHAAWQNVDCAKHLKLDVTPEVRGKKIALLVRVDGKPLEAAGIHAAGPGMEDFNGKTDASGKVEFTKAEAGVYSIRAKVIEKSPGEVDGKKYDEVRHYTTVALNVEPSTGSDTALQPLPEMITSFGGAILRDAVYTYGGHTGDAHSYSQAEQGNTLRRLDLKTGQWTELVQGPHLQGLALVAADGKLFRIGGFTAKNEEGEEHDLWSQADVASFDPNGKQWTELPPLPEPRSSFDAAVLGNTIYVIGGWKMAGNADSVWHKTAWSLDVSAENPEWKPLPAPPFQCRALAVAVHDGKVYAIGGMQQKGGPTRNVNVYDPATGKWSTGPKLVGEDGLTGFGVSAFATGGRLFASTIKGDLQRLSADGKSWEVIRKTPTARFFHRMLPLDKQHLLIVGGANMGIGKFDEVEILDVEAK